MSDGPVGQHGVGVVEQRVEQKRESQQQQRIEFEGRARISVEQLMYPARRSTPRARKTGERAKGTNWKQSGLTRLEHVEKNTSRSNGQPQQNHGDAPIDHLRNNHETPNYHETEALRKDQGHTVQRPKPKVQCPP